MNTPKLLTLFAASVFLFAACATPDAPPLRPVSAELPPLPDGVVDAADVSIEPEATRRVPPEYPYHLRSRGVTGEATLAFVVGVDGKVGEVVVTNATNEAFAKAAVDAIRKWTFKPARLNGAAVACRVSSLKFTFDT